MEKWSAVKGFEGRYEISDRGNFRSLDRQSRYSDGRTGRIKGRPLRGAFDQSTGYLVVTLDSRSKRYIHRLVAEAFLPATEFVETVNHKNGIKTDNRLENLEWHTKAQNNAHARATGLQRQHGENCNLSKFSDHTIRAVRAVHARYKPTMGELAEIFGLSLRTAKQIVRNETRLRSTSEIP